MEEDYEMKEINNLIEELDFESAKILLEKKLNHNPSNVEVIDKLSEVLLNLDDPENTIKLIKKSISLEPNKNGEKYMTMGQLSDSAKEKLKYYEKGVQVFLFSLQTETDPTKALDIKDSLASAYSSIAELYMNSELCDTDNAEDTCENCLKEALNYNPESFDALIQISNLRILRGRDEEALFYMEKIYSFVLNCINNSDDLNLPSNDILLNLSKNYAELAQYIKAIKLLDILIKLDDENLEFWYLLAFYHYNLKNFKNSVKCLKHFKKVSDKTNYKSDEVLGFEEAARELEVTLEEVRKSMGELRNNNLEESEENDEEERINNSNCDDMNIDH